MARSAHIIGHAIDIFGQPWDVRERRDTHQGWPVLIGWPQGQPRGWGGRGVAAFLTPPHADYLTVTRLCDVVLPISTTTVKRLRAQLEIRWSWEDWWAARREDLLTLTLEQFCAAHHCSMGAASQRRAALLGRCPSNERR